MNTEHSGAGLQGADLTGADQISVDVTAAPDPVPSTGSAADLLHSIGQPGAGAGSTQIRAALFDLDGVLTPTAALHQAAWQEMFEGFFRAENITPPYRDADYYECLDGRARAEGIITLLRSRGVLLPLGSESDGPELRTVHGLGARKNLTFLTVLERDGIAAFAGSESVIELLHSRNIPMAVVSSSRNAREVLDRAGITQYFAVIVDGVRAADEQLRSKPDGQMYARAAELLGFTPAQCFAAEDAISGVASAHAAGCAVVIGVDRGAGPEALTEAGANLVVDDLAELIPLILQPLGTEAGFTDDAEGQVT